MSLKHEGSFKTSVVLRDLELRIKTFLTVPWQQLTIPDGVVLEEYALLPPASLPSGFDFSHQGKRRYVTRGVCGRFRVNGELWALEIAAVFADLQLSVEETEFRCLVYPLCSMCSGAVLTPPWTNFIVPSLCAYSSNGCAHKDEEPFNFAVENFYWWEKVYKHTDRPTNSQFSLMNGKTNTPTEGQLVVDGRNPFDLLFILEDFHGLCEDFMEQYRILSKSFR